MGFSMFDNYIWDFDGTLFDTYGVMCQSLYEVIQRYQLPLSYDEMYQWIKKDSIRDLAANFLPELQTQFLADYHRLELKQQKHPKPFSQTKEVVAELNRRGKKQFILTHRDDSTLAFLEELGLLQYFSEIVTSEYQMERKPSPAAIDYLLDRHGLIPEKTVMIGDRPLDVEAGRRANVNTVLYDTDLFFGKTAASFVVYELKTILLY